MRSCGGEPVGGEPVGEAVVHRLDLGPHLGGDLGGVDAEHPRGGHGVEVAAGAERLDQAGVLGQVGHDPHLDLAVVGRQQRGVALADDERLADPAALLGADRDVLQVGVGAGEPAGRRDQLVERGVDAAVGGDRIKTETGEVAVPCKVLLEQNIGLSRLGAKARADLNDRPRDEP